MSELIQPCHFSIVVPTYNSARFLGETIASIYAQTYPHFEVIFSDDGSTDDTIQVIAEATEEHPNVPVTILENAHKGPGASRNAAIKAAQHEWVAFLDSDDVWEAEKLDTVAKTIRLAPPGVNLICHSETMVMRNGISIPLHYYRHYDDSKPLSQQLFQRNLFSTSAVVVKRSLIVAANYFAEDIYYAEDYDLWLRMSQAANVVFIKESLGRYVDRADNISSHMMVSKNRYIFKVQYRNRGLISRRYWWSMVLKRILIYVPWDLLSILKRQWVKWF